MKNHESEEKILAKDKWVMGDVIRLMSIRTRISYQAISAAIGEMFNLITEHLNSKPNAVVRIWGFGAFSVWTWKSRVVVLPQGRYLSPPRYKIKFKAQSKWSKMTDQSVLRYDLSHSEKGLMRLQEWCSHELAEMISYRTNVSYRAAINIISQFATLALDHLKSGPDARLTMRGFGEFRVEEWQGRDVVLNGKTVHAKSRLRIKYRAYNSTNRRTIESGIYPGNFAKSVAVSQ